MSNKQHDDRRLTSAIITTFRPDFEARTARANADAEGQHSQRPSGRRHAAQRDFLLHMDAEARGDRSFDRTAVRPTVDMCLKQLVSAFVCRSQSIVCRKFCDVVSSTQVQHCKA